MFFRSSEDTPSRQRRGCALGLLLCLNMFLKYSLQADNTSLWADTCVWSSLTSVTSWRYSSFLSSPNDFEALQLKSFHFRQNFSDILKLEFQFNSSKTPPTFNNHVYRIPKRKYNGHCKLPAYTDTSYSLQCSRRVAHDGIVARLMVWYEHDNYDKWVMLSLFCWKAERHGEDWPVSSSTKCYHIHLSTCCGYGYFCTSSYIFNTMTFLNLICILAHDIILWPTFSCPFRNLIQLIAIV